jgi:excisionase family DNA binding protein
MTKRIIEPSEWLTTTEAGDILHLTDWTIRQYVADGKLPASRVGNRLLIDRNEVESFIRANVGRPKGQTNAQTAA